MDGSVGGCPRWGWSEPLKPISMLKALTYTCKSMKLQVWLSLIGLCKLELCFLQLLKQYLEARLGFLFVFSSWITYVNLGRLLSLSALVSLQSLVCVAGKPMAGLMAVQDPPSLKDS